MTDVLLRHYDDGGDIRYVNGQPVLASGLETAAYLSLFGGNELDSGLQSDDPLEWWGNKSEGAASRRYRSQTQYLLASLPAVPANLRRIEDAAETDLAWFVESEAATFVGVDVRLVAINTVEIDVNIEIDDDVFSFAFTSGWGSRSTPGEVPIPIGGQLDFGEPRNSHWLVWI